MPALFRVVPGAFRAGLLLGNTTVREAARLWATSNKLPMNTHTTTVESLYREFHSILIGYVAGCFPAFSFQDSEDVVQNLFVYLQKRGTGILGDCSLASLKRHASREGIALVRERRAAKRRGEGAKAYVRLMKQRNSSDLKGPLFRTAIRGISGNSKRLTE